MKFIKNYSPAWNPLTDFELVVSMSLVPGKKLFFCLLIVYCIVFFAFSIEVRYSFCLCSHTKKMYVLNFHEILSEQLPVLSVSYTYALWQEFLNFCPKILNVCDFFNMFQIKWLKNYNQEQGLKNMKNFILKNRKKIIVEIGKKLLVKVAMKKLKNTANVTLFYNRPLVIVQMQNIIQQAINNVFG